MNKNQQEIIAFIERFKKNPLQATLDFHCIDSEYQELACQIEEFVQNVSKSYELAMHIAAGNFTTKMDSHNLCAGPLKEIQSVLQHLNWQVRQIADGDYNQSVDYLGELSESFNDMIAKLKNREFLLKENARLKEEMMEQQNKFLEHELSNQVEKYRQFSESVDELRAYRHDMKNHMLCIDILLQEGSIEEAKQYINSLSTIFQSQRKMDYEDNYILSALLNEKISKAQTMNVNITQKISIHRKLNIENRDWCTIFGNALDNALEALEKVEESKRNLEILITNHNNILSVKISNSMIGELKPQGKSFQTTKSDQYLHGLGLNNMRKAIEKYHGDMKIDIIQKQFVLTFILFDI